MPESLTFKELETKLFAVDPAILPVSSRLLRRVIRLDRRIGKLGLYIPHAKSYLIPRDRLLDCVSRLELELALSRPLPDVVLLIERPEEETLQKRAAGEILRDCWRLVFHLRVHQELERQIAAGAPTDDSLLERLRRIGSPEYAEIREVLHRDNMLLPPRSDLATYAEFAAVFLELFYFAPEQLPWHFPALLQRDEIAGLLAWDLDHRTLYRATRVPGADEPAADSFAAHGGDDFSEPSMPEVEQADPLRPSPPAYWRLIARAEKVGSAGNVAKAAILRQKASRLALPGRARETGVLAQAELERLVRRLQPALGLRDDEIGLWTEALSPLLEHADHGFRTAESRVLFDLQKVCLEHERGLVQFRLFRWLRSWGRQPLRQTLPLLSAVMAVKHLRIAAGKLAAARLTGEARTRLASLIETAVGQTQQRLRDRIRPQIAEALTAEGLRPKNVPERVAQAKIVEELLDRIVRQGYLSLGHLRDALSQNNLKLPDLASPWELLTGDVLLRLDRRLAADLPGVYSRGPVYLRGSHQLSALAFGTQYGRLLTRYLAIPYGGAFLLVEFGQHVTHGLQHPSGAPEVGVTGGTTGSLSSAHEAAAGGWSWLPVLLLGTFLALLIDREGFRRGCVATLHRLGQAVRRLAYDWPLSFFQLPWVRKFFASDFYAALIGYGVKPLAFAGCLLLPFHLFHGELAWSTWAIVFLAVNLALNLPLGRYLDQWLTEQLVRGWRELQIRVFAAVFHAIMDSFHYLLNGLERVLYTVDEWLRFRPGDSRRSVFVKLVGSSVWMVVSYVTVFVFTLLLEPQINPIKHFPVVTVSHKLLIPAGPMIVSQLTPYVGAARANTIVWSTIWLIPGVFGFLVWELKENWRLYAANRARYLKPVPIGRHGESLLRLLRLGIHSGTLPRLFRRLRRAGRRAHKTGKWHLVHKQRTGLRAVEEAIRAFLDRELVTLLAESHAWRGTRLSVDRIHLATNQVLAEIGHPDGGPGPVQLVFQERAGWIIASLSQRGWLDTVPREQREVFFQALLGLYHGAGVDLIWEPVIARFGPHAVWYDIRTEGLVLWPTHRLAAGELYRFRDAAANPSWTQLPYRVCPVPPTTLDEIFFSRRQLSWEAWVQMWEAPRQDASSPPFAPAGGNLHRCHLDSRGPMAEKEPVPNSVGKGECR